MVVVGAEGVLEQGAADSGGLSTDLSNPLSEPNGERQMLGAFNRTTWSPTKWLALEGGVRFDRYESDPHNAAYPDKEGERLSPSTSITVTPIDGLQLFTSYVEGWRPPSLRETSASALNGFLIPNPNLDPETSKNVELGFNVLSNGVLTTSDSLRFKAVRFRNNYDDYVVRVSRPGGRYTWDNIERAEFDGYELSGAYDVRFAFVEAGFTKYDKAQFCRAGVCTGSSVGTDYGIQNMPPEYSGSVTAGVRLLEERMVLGARAYFFSERLGGFAQAPSSTVAPVRYTSSSIFDLFGSYQFDDRARFEFSVENIGDRYYIDPLATGVIPSPGRTARFGLTMEF